MLQHGYPGLAEHKKIHQDFVKYVTDFIEETKRNEINISSLIGMNIKLNDWLVNHIMKEDMQYGKFIQSQK